MGRRLHDGTEGRPPDGSSAPIPGISHELAATIVPVLAIHAIRGRFREQPPADDLDTGPDRPGPGARSWPSDFGEGRFGLVARLVVQNVVDGSDDRVG